MVTQQQILADLAAIRKQLKKTRKTHKMTTQQFSQLHENSRPVNMIVMTDAADDDEMEKTKGTGKASLQSHGIFGKKMHLTTVRRPFGEAILLFSNTHGPKKAHNGKGIMKKK